MTTIYPEEAWNKTEAYRFLVEIIEEEEGGFSVVALNLPGTGSCGETREEAIKNFKEAASVTIERYLELGENIPWVAVKPSEIPQGSKWISCAKQQTAAPPAEPPRLPSIVLEHPEKLSDTEINNIRDSWERLCSSDAIAEVKRLVEEAKVNATKTKCDRCDGDGRAHGSDRPFGWTGPGTYPGPCPKCRGLGFVQLEVANEGKNTGQPMTKVEQTTNA